MVKMDLKKKLRKLAEYEINWWKAHHRRDEKGLIESSARLYELQFRVSYGIALEAAKLKLKATQEYIEAKKYDQRMHMQREADKHWSKAEELLKQHFELLTKK